MTFYPANCKKNCILGSRPVQGVNSSHGPAAARCDGRGCRLIGPREDEVVGTAVEGWPVVVEVLDSD